MKHTIFLLFLFLTNNSFAQNCDGFDKFPFGENTALSLYDSLKTLVNNEDYETALEIWQTLSKYSPAGDSIQYRYGITIFIALLTKEKNEKYIESYQNEIVNIYETHLTCLSPMLQDSGKVLESYAYSLSEVGYEDSEKTLSVYQKAIEINGNQTSPYILAYFADHVVWMYGNDLLDKTNCIKIYNQLKNIKDANIENQAYLDNWAYVEDYFAPLFPVRTFDCEYFELKMQAILKENPTDKVEIQKMINRLEEIDCADTAFFETLKTALEKIDW